MLGLEAVDDDGDDRAESGSYSATSKRRRLMPTCFGGKTTIQRSLMSSGGPHVSVQYRSSVMHLHTAAAAGGGRDGESCTPDLRQTTVNSYRLTRRRRSSATRRHFAQDASKESETTVNRCHADCDSAMTSDERHCRHDTRTRHTDSGYEGTWCDYTSSPAPPPLHLALSRG